MNAMFWGHVDQSDWRIHMLFIYSDMFPAIYTHFQSNFKGSGARILCKAIGQYFSGVNIRLVQSQINLSNDISLLRPLFVNRPPPKSIKAKRPMERHQIDLVNLSLLESEGQKYVLSVLDIYSRFLWLRPLKNKTSDAVSRALKEIYVDSQWGYPSGATMALNSRAP
jgi:hypothetical protein